MHEFQDAAFKLRVFQVENGLPSARRAVPAVERGWRLMLKKVSKLDKMMGVLSPCLDPPPRCLAVFGKGYDGRACEEAAPGVSLQ